MKLIFKILISALLIALTGLCFSCDIYKKSSKTKSDTDFTEQIETKTFRKGDTVHYQIPNVVYKDTTIYRKNVQGSTLKIVYDRQGNTSSIDCIASMYEESVKENRRLQQQLKEKDSEKKEEVNTTIFFYFFWAICGIVCFAILMFYFYIRKQTAVTNSIIERIMKL
jgi:hypothetical protein